MSIKLNEEQTDRFSRLIFQGSRVPTWRKHEEGERLRADESKALHLEYPEAAMAHQEPTTGPAALAEMKAICEKAENRRRQYILDKVNSSGLSRKEIGSRSGYKNLNKFFRKYDEFLQSGKSDDSIFMGPIYKIFDIRKKDIPVLSDSERERIAHLKILAHEPFNLFVKNYRLVNKYAAGICNTPELATIPIGAPVEFFGMWFGGKSSADLGKLLTLYAAGLLRGEPCEACGSRETLIYQNAGSMLSGGTFLSASVCLECQKQCSNSRFDRDIVLASLRYDRIAPFPGVQTRWAMRALIHALKALDK